MRITPGNADIHHRRADQLAAVGDQHDLLILRYREGGHHIAIPAGCFDIDNSLPAAVCHTIFIGVGPLAVAIFSNGEQHFLFCEQRFVLSRIKPRIIRHSARFINGFTRFQVSIAGFRIRIHGFQDRHADHTIALGQLHAAHATGITPFEQTHIRRLEADTFAALGRQQHVGIRRTYLHADKLIILIQLHGDLAV